MTHAGIECFLAVCRYKTGSRAAQALFITQSSLSTRLKALEKELGGALFYRKQGCREMTLTAAGKEFYDLAIQYEEILDKMQHIFHQQGGTLRVSSFNSIGTYLLPAAYERFLTKNPQIHLEIQDMELAAALRSIHEDKTDLAFTCGKTKDSTLTTTPLFSEPMVLVCAKGADYSQPVSVGQLSLANEVYIEWSNSFARWHQQVFGSEQPQICISIMVHLHKFIGQKQHWAIVPVSTAKELEKEGLVRRLQTDFNLPAREVSGLTPVDTPNKEAIQAFLDCLREIIAEQPEIISHM